MSSILSSISNTATRAGLRVVIAGQEKLGKSTLAAFAPKPLLLPLEVGYAGLSVDKTNMLQSLREVTQALDEILYYCGQKNFPYKSIILDSCTALERFIHEDVVQRDPQYKAGGKKMTTMETAHGGYGRGHSLANDDFDGILKRLDVLAAQYGINIIFTCHVFSSKVMDPTSGEYDSWDLLLHSPKNNKTYGKREMLTQWADVIGFLYEPVFVSKDANLSRAHSQNKGRVIGLSRTPAYVAGNRLGVIGEFPVPPPPANGWNTIAHAIYSASPSIDVFTR